MGIAFSPDGSTAYLTDVRSRVVYVIDTETNAVSTEISNGFTEFSEPIQVAFTPNGIKAYVTDYDNCVVYAIDTATQSVSAEVRTTFEDFSQPYGVAVTPDGTTAYITDFNNGKVYAIDVATDAVIVILNDEEPLYQPHGIAISPDGALGYIAASNPSVVEMDILNNTLPAVISNILTPFASPIAIAMLPPAPAHPSVLPAIQLIGSQLMNKFLFQKQYYNTLSWKASPSVGTVGYHIYRDNVLIGSTSELQYVDLFIHKKGHINTKLQHMMQREMKVQGSL